MKELQTENRNIVKVTKALNLIWYNVENELNLDLISSSCNLSKFHFHRVFLEYQGESLGNYIARKRIERAANRLIYFPYYSVSQIASSLGYSSPSNFSKAFNKYTGMSPKQWRHIGYLDSIRSGELNSKYGKVLEPELVYSKYKFAEKHEQTRRLKELDNIISITSLNEQYLMYLSTHNGTHKASWEPTWEELNQWIKCNPSSEEIQRFGIWYDNMDICPKELIRYDAAISIPKSLEVKAPYMTQRIGPGYYATGKLCGTPSDIRNTVRDIYTFWLVERGYIPDYTPYCEKYLTEVGEDGHYQIQFYIKLKSKRKISIN